MTIYRKDTRFTDVADEGQAFIVECNGRTCTRKLEIDFLPRGTKQDADFAEGFLSPSNWGMVFETPDRPARHYCPEHRIRPVLNAHTLIPEFLAERMSPAEGDMVPTARVFDEYQRFIEELPQPPGVVPGKHALFEAVRALGGRTSTKSIRLDGRSTTMPVFRDVSLKVSTPGDHLQWYGRQKGAKVGSISMKKQLAAKAASTARRRADQALSAKLRYHGLEPKVALACAAQGCTELALESAAGDLGWVRAVVGEHELYACLAHASVFDGIREATAPTVASLDDDDEGDGGVMDDLDDLVLEGEPGYDEMVAKDKEN